MTLAVLSMALFLLSVISGMLGIGVAFAAVPPFSLVLPGLAWAIPISLATTRMSTASLRKVFAATIIGVLAYRALRHFA